MEKTGINLEDLKTRNRSSILQLLNRRGPMSRKDIAEELGLTPAGVTKITTEMIGEGILQELGELQENKRAGRKKILLGINYNYRNVIAISLEYSDLTITICNLKGDVICNRKWENIDTTKSSEEFLHDMAKECKMLMWESNVLKSSVLGVGLSGRGRFDRKTGVGWRPDGSQMLLDFGDVLQKELGFPVVVENNAKAFAEAGLVYRNEKEEEDGNYLLIKWGPGVVASLIINRSIYGGYRENAGEIGHIRIHGNKKLCRCGRIGCLESLASVTAIAEMAREICSPEDTPELFALINGNKELIKGNNIGWWTQVGDVLLWNRIREITAIVAEVVCNTITIVAPEKIILYGRMFEIPHIMDYLMEECKAYDPSYDNTKFELSDIQQKNEYIGSLAIVVNELFLSGVRDH